MVNVFIFVNATAAQLHGIRKDASVSGADVFAGRSSSSFFLIAYLKFQNAVKDGNIGLVRQLFFQCHGGVNVRHADRVLRQLVCMPCA